MKELVKIYLLKKSGLKLSDLPSMIKESPTSSDPVNKGPPTTSSDEPHLILKATPPEDIDSHTINNHPYAKVNYADIMRNILSEKVHISFIHN